MDDNDLQSRCAEGQRLLGETQYLRAERVLRKAEREAYAAGDFDTLARLYMPLQEARRQRRLMCAEGIVHLGLWADGPRDRVEAGHVLDNYSKGQLLVAGWGSIQPAVEVRRLADERGLHVETFLGAVYPISGGGRVVVIAPTADVRLPDATVRSRGELAALFLEGCLLFDELNLPRDARAGSAETFAEVAGLWERLHSPFLEAADAETDVARRIAGYRRTLEVDYACELAHQRLSDAARSAGR